MTTYKEIEGYEDYLIGDNGVVLSKKNGRNLRAGINNRGYLNVVLCKKGIGKNHRIHRLVACAFIENPDNKEMVDHINRVKTDNRLENLRWTTSAENNQNRKIYSNNKLGVEGICETSSINGKYLYYRARIKANGKNHTKYFPQTELGLIEAIAWRVNMKQLHHIN